MKKEKEKKEMVGAHFLLIAVGGVLFGVWMKFGTPVIVAMNDFLDYLGW